jgi:hypothetical protein
MVSDRRLFFERELEKSLRIGEKRYKCGIYGSSGKEIVFGV